MMYWNHDMTAGGWIDWILATVILLALTLAALVWISRELRCRREPGRSGASSALEILDQRLADGEIETDQYIELRRTLVSRPDPVSTPH